MTICGSCYGAGGRWDDEVQDQWYPCVACNDIAAAREEGRREEREDVVAWLRRSFTLNLAGVVVPAQDGVRLEIAGEVERGEHVGAAKGKP